MSTTTTTTGSKPKRNEMKVFRLCNQVWIYMGEVDLTTGESTFGELLATDRLSHDFPAVGEDCELMETAEEAGLV